MKSIDYKKVNLSDEEFEYYNELVKQFAEPDHGLKGDECFKDLFETDVDGNIIIISPKKTIPWVALHFVQQVQISQRLRMMDGFNNKIKQLEKRIEQLEKK